MQVARSEMPVRMPSRYIVVALAAVLLTGGMAIAHHGVSGLYDTSRPVALTGVVTTARFTPPHPVISVRVDDAGAPGGDLGRPDEITGPITARREDVGQVLDVEFSPVRAFYALNGALRPGDRVTIVALRNCRPPHQLRSSWIRLPAGDTVSYEGGLHRRADGCPSSRS
jgi:hypothetical protein